MPAGMHQGAARPQLNRLPWKRIAPGLPGPSTPHSPAQDRGAAHPRDGGPWDRPPSENDGPLGVLSRFGGPRAVRQLCLRTFPPSQGGWRPFVDCLRGPSIESIKL